MSTIRNDDVVNPFVLGIFEREICFKSPSRYDRNAPRHSFFCAGNEPCADACVRIWRLPQH